VLKYTAVKFILRVKVSKKTILHLARHGQTEWNTEHRIQGQLDSPLTVQGKQQAEHLARLCLSLNISKILTSPLGRAVQTAGICAHKLNLDVMIIDGIKERHFGQWQGLLTPQVQGYKDYTEITSQITECEPKEGESAKQLLSRFEQALKIQVKEAPNDTYLVVTHGDVLRCFMAQFLTPEQSQTGYDYKNGHLISIAYDHSRGCFLPL
jgi:broad specificity phosphatase PhoE